MKTSVWFIKNLTIITLYFAFAYMLYAYKVDIILLSPYAVKFIFIISYSAVVTILIWYSVFALPIEQKKERQLEKIINFAHKKIISSAVNNISDYQLWVRFGDLLKTAAYVVRAYYTLRLDELYGKQTWHYFVSCLGTWAIRQGFRIDYRFNSKDLAPFGYIKEDLSIILPDVISDLKNTLMVLEYHYQKDGMIPEEKTC